MVAKGLRQRPLPPQSKTGNYAPKNCSYMWIDIYIFNPQPLRAVGVLFSPMVSGWAGGRRDKVCPGCISETVRCRKLILGRDIGQGGVGVQRHGVTLI